MQWQNSMMKLEQFTPRFPIDLSRPGRAGHRTWHTFRVGTDGVDSIEATSSGVVIRIEGRTLLLTDQGWGYTDATVERRPARTGGRNTT